MKICTVCNHENREGQLFCEECGHDLGDVINQTLLTNEMRVVTDDLLARATWGTAKFGKDARIVLQVQDHADPITVRPDRRTILGRSDPNSKIFPDVDLSNYGAQDQGVSRLHAAIYRNEDTLVLVDMGSANGTELNGQRLVPEQPRVLRDGDEMRLGKLTIHIYFKGSPT